MKDRVGRRHKLGHPLAAIFGFTRWPEDLTPDIYRAHWGYYASCLQNGGYKQKKDTVDQCLKQDFISISLPVIHVVSVIL